MEFTERTPLERGFAALFRDRVREPLLALEQERLSRLRKARGWGSIAVLVTAALVALTLFGARGDWRLFAALVVGVLGLIGGLAAWHSQASGWKGAVERTVMPAVCDHVGGLHYDGHGGQGFPLGAMRGLGVLPAFNRSSLSDELRGTYHGTPFELVEARLKRRRRDSDGDTKTTTVFRGLLFHVGVPVEAPTRILIARDWGAIGNRLGTLFSGGQRAGMPRVEFDHPDFEAAFEVHADDPQAARDFMPPAFLDSLLAIGQEQGGRRGVKSLTAGFEGRSFYLALARDGDFLRMGSLRTPVAEMEEDLHAIFADIELVHRIIDRLHGR